CFRRMPRLLICFFFSSRRRHTRLVSDWSSDVCSSDLFFSRERELAPLFYNLDVAKRPRRAQRALGLPMGRAAGAAGLRPRSMQGIGKASCRGRGGGSVGRGGLEREGRRWGGE